MMKALVNTYCNDQSSGREGGREAGGFIHHVFMHPQENPSAALKYAHYPKVDKKKKINEKQYSYWI